MKDTVVLTKWRGIMASTRSILHRLVCLDTWSPDGGAVWVGGTLRRWGLAGGSTPQWWALRVYNLTPFGVGYLSLLSWWNLIRQLLAPVLSCLPCLLPYQLLSLEPEAKINSLFDKFIGPYHQKLSIGHSKYYFYLSCWMRYCWRIVLSTWYRLILVGSRPVASTNTRRTLGSWPGCPLNPAYPTSQ